MHANEYKESDCNWTRLSDFQFLARIHYPTAHRNLQYLLMPSACSSKYWRGSIFLNVGNRTRISVSSRYDRNPRTRREVIQSTHLWKRELIRRWSFVYYEIINLLEEFVWHMMNFSIKHPSGNLNEIDKWIYNKYLLKLRN